MNTLPTSTTSPSLVAPFAPARKATLAERAVLRSLAAMRRGHLRLELSDGTSRHFGEPAASMDLLSPRGFPVPAIIRVLNPAFFKKCLWSGDIGFAESYLDGDWTTPDVAAVIAWFILNVEDAPTLSGSRRASATALNVLRWVNRVGHLLRPNSRSVARRNISEHYDLSNEFFALFLDPSMMYSSAKWTTPKLTLAEAQVEKNEALCRSLKLKATDHVLEIGTGWGGWAMHAARNYGCRVTTLTISQQQYDGATARIAAAGLSQRITVQMVDYRDIGGTYDKIVSIEMMEAIGHRYLPDFCAALHRLLKPDGLIALQFITCPDSRYAALRSGVDFIQKHIFPGSLLLSLNRVNAQLTAAGGFVVHQVEDLGSDYSRTLHLWHENFRLRLAEVRALGFDERFTRKWTYYLGYCEAAFAMRNVSVVQTVHTRPNNLSL